MSKFIADRTYRMTDENGNLIISFVVSGERKHGGLIAFEELRKIDGLIDVDLKKYKSKRSLEQNRLLWALLGKMAMAMSGRATAETTEECYIAMLESANVKADFLIGLPEVADSLRQVYRIVRKVDERKENGKTVFMYQCFTGSSKFDTKQMTDLIEHVLDKLAELGIYDSEIEQARCEYGM